jgi:hypothetical protein
MTIFGIGSFFIEDGEDLTNDFLKDGVACLGRGEKDSPTLYEIMAHIKVGDIIYIKRFLIGKGLRIMAIGIVNEHKFIPKPYAEPCLSVKWVWTEGTKADVSLKWEDINDKYNVRSNSLYEEYNPIIQEKVINLLTNSLK